jgi:hypothetical protein
MAATRGKEGRGLFRHSSPASRRLTSGQLTPSHHSLLFLCLYLPIPVYRMSTAHNNKGEEPFGKNQSENATLTPVRVGIQRLFERAETTSIYCHRVFDTRQTFWRLSLLLSHRHNKRRRGSRSFSALCQVPRPSVAYYALLCNLRNSGRICTISASNAKAHT